MTREYRSVLPKGSPRWATRRTQWRILGVSEADLDKPKIAIVNSSSGLAPCFSHLDAIAVEVKRRIEEAGAVAFEIRTVAPTDFVMAAGGRGGYVLSSRDLIANDIEAAVEGAQLDGMICLASCDKTTPGQLMAAARLDVPTVIVPCGYQPCGFMADGERVDIEEVFLKAGHLPAGRITLPELCDMSDRAIQGPGVCSGMGTANSMHIMAESLGMTVPGAAPVRANSDKMWADAAAAASAVVDAVEADRRPRQVLTVGAFRNAVRALIAVSGSINCVKHLQAIAREADVEIDIVAEVEAAGRSVRPLAAVRPNGSDSIEEFEDSGGAREVLRQLAPVLDRETVTVTGESTAERVSAAPRPEPGVIRPLDAPAGDHATLRIVRGSLAPDGSIVKLAVTEKRALAMTGPARVFDSAPAALEGISSGAVSAGDVLVLRGLGPVGTPGMGMASNVVFALDGAGLTGEVAVVTDGQLSGLVNKGIVIGEVRPEGVAPASPLGLVENGDTIRIDVTGGIVDLDVPADELRRRGEHARSGPLPESGWLGQYAHAVEPLSRGATLRYAADRQKTH